MRWPLTTNMMPPPGFPPPPDEFILQYGEFIGVLEGHGWKCTRMYDQHGPYVQIDSRRGAAPIFCRVPVNVGENHITQLDSIYRVHGDLMLSIGLFGSC